MIRLIFLGNLTQSQCRLQIDDVDIQQMREIVMNMDTQKSPGNDKISPRFVRECVDEVAPTLVEIFNKIISTSEYPDILKIHKVVPIPKQSHASSVNHYRPVAVLSTIDKILEKILFNKLLLYLESNNLLYDGQFGFRRGCGTEDAVLNVVKCICEGLDKGSHGVAGLFFDFTKAFDLVDHDILLRKLSLYGIMGSELSLFKSYLSNRKQFVQINESKSHMASVVHGVPQGSGLGPLLFSIYVNDLKNLGFKGQLYMFADDVCMFYPYKYDLVLKSNMERDVALLFEYARLNGLMLNPSKTKMVRFRPQAYSLNHDFSVNVDGILICETQSVKYLGITLQGNMSWDIHIDNVKRKIAPAIGILYKLKNKLNEKAKRMIFQSLVQSHLGYLAVVYAYNRNSNSLKSLQSMQNRALKIVYNLPLTYSTIALYKDVAKTILPIYGLHEYQVLMFVFKCIRKLGHHTIAFTQNQTNVNTRNRMNLRIPLCRLEKSKQRIDYIGSVIYNDLPSDLKTIIRFSNFKFSCKMLLCSKFETLLL